LQAPLITLQQKCCDESSVVFVCICKEKGGVHHTVYSCRCKLQRVWLSSPHC